MTSTLVNLYANHVLEGKRTLESVPDAFRDEVREIVEAEAEKELEGKEEQKNDD